MTPPPPPFGRVSLRLNTTIVRIAACYLVALAIAVVIYGTPPLPSYIQTYLTKFLPPQYLPHALGFLGVLLFFVPKLLTLMAHRFGVDVLVADTPLLPERDWTLLTIALYVPTASLLLVAGLAAIAFSRDGLQEAALSQHHSITALRTLAHVVALDEQSDRIYATWGQHYKPLRPSDPRAAYPFDFLPELLTLLGEGSDGVINDVAAAASRIAEPSSPRNPASLPLVFFSRREPVTRTQCDDRAVSACLVARTLASSAQEGLLSRQVDYAEIFFDYALRLNPSLVVAKNGKAVCATHRLIDAIARAPEGSELTPSDWQSATRARTSLSAPDLAGPNVVARSKNNLINLDLWLIYALRVKHLDLPAATSLQIDRQWVDKLRPAAYLDALCEQIARLEVQYPDDIRLRFSHAQALLLRARLQSLANKTTGSSALLVNDALQILTDARMALLYPEMSHNLAGRPADDRAFWGLFHEAPFADLRATFARVLATRMHP